MYMLYVLIDNSQSIFQTITKDFSDFFLPFTSRAPRRSRVPDWPLAPRTFFDSSHLRHPSAYLHRWGSLGMTVMTQKGSFRPHKIWAVAPKHQEITHSGSIPWDPMEIQWIVTDVHHIFIYKWREVEG